MKANKKHISLKTAKLFKDCGVESCNNKHHLNGYCVRHYMQIRKHGKILKRTIYDKNKYIDKGDYCEIVLYSKTGIGEEPKEIAKTLIDKDDYNKVKDYKWALSGIYVRNSQKKLLHRFILGEKNREIIDHINQNPLDNRKQNLRHCTRQQNRLNNKQKGYCWHKRDEKWQASIKLNGKRIHLGVFTDEKDAKKARVEAEKKYFGEYAPMN